MDIKKDTKKTDREGIKKLLGYAVMILITVLTVYTCSARRGFWATLPFVTVGSLVTAFICYEPRKTALLGAICAFAFSLADQSGMRYGILLSIGVGVAILLSFYSAKLFVKAFRKNNYLWLIPALLLLVPGPLAQSRVFSTLWENRRMQAYFEEYAAKKYPDQKFEDITAYYDVLSGEYRALMRFRTSASSALEATVCLNINNGIIMEDGFFNLFCQRGLEKQQSEFANLIRSEYPNDSLWLDCSKTTVRVSSADSFSGVYGSNPDWLKGSAAINLGFKFSIVNRESFLEKVKEYYQYILSTDFECEQIRFFGGDRGTYLYTLTIPYGTPADELAGLLRSCNISMDIPDLSMEYSYLFGI